MTTSTRTIRLIIIQLDSEAEKQKQWKLVFMFLKELYDVIEFVTNGITRPSCLTAG